MSVIGIDFGTMFSVVAVVKRGIDIIDNEVSKRQTSSIVGFDEKKRDLGESARSSWKKNFRSTVFQVKRLLQSKWSVISKEKPYIGACRLKQGEGDSVLVDVNYKGQQYSFTPEQIVAMFFTNLKQITERKTGTNIADAVISVPGYYTDDQRRAVIDAAGIAGINVIRVINDLSAVSLYYSYNNRNFGENDVKNVLILDVGAANTSAGVVEFKKGAFKLLSTTYENDLGGRTIDIALAKHFEARFNSKYNVELKENPRSWIRLLMACENVKKNLNLGTVSNINEACLFEDFDMSDTIKKDEYLVLLKPILDRLVNLVLSTVEKSGLKLDQISSIEWIGSSMRVVEFQNTLSAALGRPVENHMNAEESIAQGCALQCAFLSPRVYFSNKITVGDVQDYGISIIWNTVNDPNDTKESKLQLVKPGYNLTRNKPLRLTLKRPTKDMQVLIVYDNPSELPPGGNPVLGKYLIKNIPSFNGQTEVDLRFKFKHDFNGITNLLKAEVVETKEVEVEVPIEEKKDTTTPQNNTNTTPNTENKETKKDQDGDTKMEETTTPKTEKKKKTETTYHPLTITRETAGLAPEQIKKFRELEEKFITEDLYVYQVAEAKNKLETYIYDSRAKLGEIWNEYTTSGEKQQFNAALDTAYNWFESNPEGALNEYQNKLNDLLVFGNKYQKRVYEREELPGAIASLLSTIENYKAKVASGDPAYAHIDKTKLDSIIAECDRVHDLFKENIEKTKTLAKHEDPLLNSNDLKERVKNLSKFAEDILNTPKPKTEEKKDDKKTDNKTPNSPQTDKMETEQTPPNTPQQNTGDKMDTEPNQ